MSVTDNKILLGRLSPHRAALARMFMSNARNLDRYAQQQREQGAPETALKCIRAADNYRAVAEDILLEVTQVPSVPVRRAMS